MVPMISARFAYGLGMMGMGLADAQNEEDAEELEGGDDRLTDELPREDGKRQGREDLKEAGCRQHA